MNTMKMIVLALILVPAVNAQTDYDRNTVLLLNIPEKVRNLLNNNHLDSEYEISFDINPSYLRGDYNGDGIMDYAIRIRNKKNGKIGIAICHPELNKVYIFAAGTKDSRTGDDFQHLDMWQVASRSIYPDSIKKFIKGEVLCVQKFEAGGASIYWNGKKYIWLPGND